VGTAHLSAPRKKHRESDVWQRRFWEHVIADKRDYQNHLDYLHFNPVKHGLCACPHQGGGIVIRAFRGEGGI
jgi:putative transposase